jgi:hypothetical protein
MTPASVISGGSSSRSPVKWLKKHEQKFESFDGMIPVVLVAARDKTEFKVSRERVNSRRPKLGGRCGEGFASRRRKSRVGMRSCSDVRRRSRSWKKQK